MAKRNLPWLNPAITTGACVPFAAIGWRAYRHELGANPVATGLNQVGLLALILLVACLACTPLKILFAWTWPLRIRRTLGLCGFFAALVHFSIYLVLDQGLAFGALFQDVLKRPFIAVGFTALLLLVPLAVTSTKRSVQRLGFARWQRLHRLAYVSDALGVLHFYLRVKADHTQPSVYGLLLGFGFALRVGATLKKSRDVRTRAALRAARTGNSA